MSGTRLHSSRKRRTPEDSVSHPNGAPQQVFKRQKLEESRRSQNPLAFWDSLSKIDLTKYALRELDRRNFEARQKPDLPYARLRRRNSLRALWEPESCSQAVTPAANYLKSCQAGVSKKIEQFARHGGPDLLDLVGNLQILDIEPWFQADPVLTFKYGAQDLLRVPEAARSRSTGPYNRNFQQILIDAGFYPSGYETPNGRVPAIPDNWDEINRRLKYRRPSLCSPNFSQEDFDRFVREDCGAAKEKQVSTSVIPIIGGNAGDPKCVSGGVPFANLDHLPDGTVVPGNPDIYYGARPEELDRRVRYELSGQIIPTTQEDLPIAPNFFLAVKGPEGIYAVAGRQACYDGALGARGMHSLQSFGQEKLIFDNNAYTISSIYYAGTLRMFTSHPSRPTSPRGRPEYCMKQLNAWAMTGNVETFREGAAAYRNARDWAKEQRSDAIRGANERAARL
ncbi:MAG: hypothetical protein M4579_005617 [Chaenotheca gracillima]|nr:MAG: hypothetical protein M4579_005617 [Chaenotheca gracillima]